MPMTARRCGLTFISDNSILHIGLVKGERLHGNKVAHTNQVIQGPFAGKYKEEKPEDSQCL